MPTSDRECIPIRSETRLSLLLPLVQKGMKINFIYVPERLRENFYIWVVVVRFWFFRFSVAQRMSPDPDCVQRLYFKFFQTCTNILIVHPLMRWNHTGDSWTTVFAPARMPALLSTGRRSPAFLPPALWRIPLQKPSKLNFTQSSFLKKVVLFRWSSRSKFLCNFPKCGKRLRYLWLRDLQIRHPL